MLRRIVHFSLSVITNLVIANLVLAKLVLTKLNISSLVALRFPSFDALLLKGSVVGGGGQGES